MNLKQLIFTLLSIAFFAGCEDSKEPQAASSAVAAPDQTENAFFNSRNFKQLQLPLSADTAFVSAADTNERISYAELRSQGVTFPNEGITSNISNELTEFCLIDSLKKNNKYSEYAEKLDIGMTKNSIAFKVGYVSLSGQSHIYLWGMESSSYEACPFHSGKYIVATLVDGIKPARHFLLAERSAGGDPPSMGSTDMSAEIKADGRILLTCLDTFDDLDQPGNSVTTKTATYSVQNGSITFGSVKSATMDSETKAAEN